MEDELNMDFIPETIDGLVYCVGSINLKPFKRIKPENFLEDFSLQVVGAIKVLQRITPHFKNSEAPSVVFFSTVAVQNGFNFHSQVSTSKGAIEGLTRALAAELAPAIRVNCIAPSLTQTPLASKLLSSEEKIEANDKRHPLGRIGQPEDLAQMAQFLLSSKSGWITGQVFGVDGGMSVVKG
jgi:NAD(P)-dependent dehydrogenase (short-subunit alcohol dehydrogenase family)